ncbi:MULTISPECIES: hypothetical protein [unclassified Streptomyces]|uniref:hypothetical protein n=1 Tax=unclassified Streptomyces TaxID=2593676 RepID=UPI0015EBB0A4|nr:MULTISPECIES: hypothetical protein [unclassified Streptomyces]
MVSPQEPALRQRSAAELNALIRDLILRTGGTLNAEEQREYEELVVQWAAADRRQAWQ